MRIHKLRLKNFRCFEEAEITLHPNYTVLIGINGAGKSTVLDALSIALGGFLTGFDGIASTYIRTDDAHYKMFRSGSRIEPQEQFPVEIYAEGIVQGSALSWQRELNGMERRTTHGNAKQIVDYARSLQEAVREGVSCVLPLVAYYGTGRLWLQKQNRRKESETALRLKRQMGYTDCLSSMSNDKQMLQWFRKMTYIQLQEGHPLPELEAVKSALRQCYLSVSPDVTDAQFHYDVKSGELKVLTERSGGTEEFPVRVLSDGEKGIVSLVADIAYRMALLNPELPGGVLTTPGVVLIDEIDLHLHPQWQKKIVGDYDAVQQLVDEDSIVDLYLLDELTHNVDVHYSSTRFYIENGKLYAGPPWDFDLSMGNLDENYYGEVAYSTDTLYATTSGWIAKLVQYEDFRAAFLARYDELYETFENLYQDNALGTSKISALYTTYQAALEREGAVWGFVKSSDYERTPDADYETNVEFLRSWLKAHNEWLRDNLEQAICPHSFEDYVYNDDATCTADGTETAVCANGCGAADTRTKTGTMTAHRWDSGTVTQEPTETQMGERLYTCTGCGGKRTESFVDFSDIGEDYYADAVRWAAAQGITTGTTPVSFEPDKSCTRAEIVTFLYRAAGSPAVEGDSGFADVAEDAYYADAVAWAVQQGITQGTSAAEFSPNAACTRAEAVTFLYRAAGQPAVTETSAFADVPADEWYASAVLWAAKSGVAKGASETAFAPHAACTRAQIVTMQYRFAALPA